MFIAGEIEDCIVWNLNWKFEWYDFENDKDLFLVVTSCGFFELRQFIDGQDFEVNRKLRNQLLIDNISNYSRCQKCNKIFFPSHGGCCA